jgi:hypothetical protein
MENVNQIIKEIVDKNSWLNGWYDYEDGDLMAIVNQPEKFTGKPKEHTSLIQLYDDLQNYDGVFKYKNLLFFNDWQYGTFVYDINNPDTSDYIEHLTINAMPYEHFAKLINKLTTPQ